MTEREKLLDALDAYLLMHGQHLSRFDIARALGWDSRRLSRIVRTRLGVAQLQEALAHWAQHRPAVQVVVRAGEMRVVPDEPVAVVDRCTAFFQRDDITLTGQAETAIEVLLAGLRGILDTTGALRVMALRAAPKLAGGLLMEPIGHVVAEVVCPPTPLVSHHWSGVPLSDEYLAMLGNVVEKGGVTLLTAHMPEGRLRALYEEHGIHSAEVVLIRKSTRAFWYVSAVYDHVVDTDRLSVVAKQVDRLRLPAKALERVVLSKMADDRSLH